MPFCRISLFILVMICSMNQLSYSQELDYNWKNVPIGGGGYITGMKIHPEDPDVRIYRTDVGGAYKFNRVTGRMDQLIFSTEESYYSVQGIALHPTNTDIIYLAVGRNCKASTSAILKSTDGGVTFDELEVTGDNGYYFAGNGSRNCSGNDSDKDRQGTPIAINPRNTNELYVGTVDRGLYIINLNTLVGTQLPSSEIPYNTDRKSIRSVVFHPTENLVYIAYPDQGVYMGNTITRDFSLINNTNAAKQAIDISISKDADYLVVACRREGILKCSNIINGTNWTSLSNGLFLNFDDDPDRGNEGYLTVDCSPHENDYIITVTGGFNHINEFQVSTSAGNSWNTVNGSVPNGNNPFEWRSDSFASHVAQIAYHPEDPSTMYYTSWFSTFQSNDFSFTNGGTWNSIESKGHEEIVPTDLMTFPENSADHFVISGSGDHLGFVFGDEIENPENFAIEDVSDLTDDNLGKLKKSASYAFCEKQPDHLALVITDEWVGSEGGLLTSEDGGLSWDLKSGYASDDVKSVVEMSSNDPDNMVIINQNGIKYTRDGANTNFISASGVASSSPDCNIPFSVNCLAPTNVNTGNSAASVFSASRTITADKELPCVFYYYDWNGTFNVSTNGGEDWCIVSNDLPSISLNNQGEFNSFNKSRLISIPSRPGHLWINVNNQLWFSQDGGANWENLSADNNNPIDVVKALSFGKGVTDQYSSLFAFGQLEGTDVDLFYRSDDMGQTWILINDHDQNELWTDAKMIAGDRNIAGRLYASVSGQGVVFGDDLSIEQPDQPEDCGSEELIVNGTFDTPSAGVPNFNLAIAATADAVESVNNNGEALISITDGGSFNYDVQIWQDDLAMEIGKRYRLKTVARADQPRDITIRLRNRSNGSQTYHLEDLTLTTSHQEFIHEFVAENSDNDLRLTHLVGISNANVYFDEISFEEITGEDADGDGVCDEVDVCPNFDDALIGTSCDDGDPNTENDIYTTNCQCQGTMIETEDCGSVELVVNGDFDLEGSDIPDFRLNNNANSASTGSINEFGVAVIDITDGGQFNYDVQIWQDDLAMEIGKTYRLKTIARADQPRDITIRLRNRSNGSQTYHLEDLSLTTSFQEFVHEFVAEADDNDLRLTHLLGISDVNIYFDVISFAEITGEDSDGDGILDCVDECPMLDDSLIGTSCDDGDSSTSDDIYTENCECQGSLIATADLNTSISVLPTTGIQGPRLMRTIVQIRETSGIATDPTKEIILTITTNPNYSFVWEANATEVAGEPNIDNSLWEYDDSLSASGLWIFKRAKDANGMTIPISANGLSQIGFIGTWDAESSGGQTSIAATILNNSGGEVNSTNNTDNASLNYLPASQ